jgi:hypothetical protein
MITELILSLLGYIFQIIGIILPTWNVWPDNVFHTLNYFGGLIGDYNFIFPVDTLFNVILIFTRFLTYFMIAKLIAMIFNYLRGTGKGIDI